MEALYLLIPLSVAIVGLAAWIFLRMSDSGQFDDMEGTAHSILLDDDRPAVERDGNDDGSASPRSASREKQGSSTETPGCH